MSASPVSSLDLEEGVDINWNDLDRHSAFDPDQPSRSAPATPLFVDPDHLVDENPTLDEHL